MRSKAQLIMACLPSMNALYKCRHFNQKYSIKVSCHMNANTRGEETIIDVLNRLKEELSQSNYVNIGNLTALTNNIEFLFTYVRSAFISIVQQKDVLQQKLATIESKLRQHNLAYILEEVEQLFEEQDAKFSNNLNELNQRMQEAIIQKGELDGLNRKDFDARSQFSTRSRSNAADKKQNNHEYNKATSFVREHLADKLEEEPSRTIDLPKNAILNLYTQWREKQQQPVDYKHLSSIQMALTNQIKRQFPHSTHNARSFRGLQFKQQFKPTLKTDVKSRIVMEEQCDKEDSPPLPTFADDHLAM